MPTYHPEEGPSGQSSILFNSGQDTEDEADQNNEEAVKQGHMVSAWSSCPRCLPPSRHPTRKIISAGNPKYPSASALRHGVPRMETIYHHEDGPQTGVSMYIDLENATLCGHPIPIPRSSVT